ncbi:MAG: zinc ribbon domain-containing protein [Dehalococcoidia bacterium]|nr:zinc ribbon domain-containing protein [Dehalococcoidia bacterium]MDD5648555.1 zinc ribbon domain-containing protein [Dehalococcoidia bacterium]
MPIYEYICPKCHIRFEQLRSLSSAEEDADCPKCNAPSGRAISKFVSRSKSDFGMLDHMPSSGGGKSCSGCSSTNCSTCG